MPALAGLLWRLSAYASKILLMEDESGAALVIVLRVLSSMSIIVLPSQSIMLRHTSG